MRYSHAMAMVGVMAAAAAAQAFREATAKADAAWVPYAAARGMSYRPGRQGWAHTEMPRLDGVFHDVRVAVELGQGASQYLTAALAVSEAPLAGHLEVTREGSFAKVAKLFGAQDVVLGDETFDRAFLVKSKPADVAPQLLSPAIRAEMLALPTTWLAYDHGREHGQVALVIFSVADVVQSADVLDRILRVATMLARVRPASVPYR